MHTGTNDVEPTKDRKPGAPVLDVRNAERAGGRTLHYQVSPRAALVWLGVLTLALNSISVVARGVERLAGYEETTDLVRLFHVAEEGNLTTWFSAMLLLCGSILLAATGRAVRRQSGPHRWHWLVLSAVFFLMCLDEAAGIHELTIGPLRSLMHASGVFYYAWVILALPFVIGLAIAYSGFLRDLPRDTGLLFVVSGGAYVLGAMGMDMAAGCLVGHSVRRLIEPILITVEELLENVGIVVFIYALLSHLRVHLEVPDIRLHIA